VLRELLRGLLTKSFQGEIYNQENILDATGLDTMTVILRFVLKCDVASFY